MPHRFYCSDLAESGTIILGDAEAHHLAHVLRHQSGDLVELFNGEGRVATSRITAVRRRDVELEIVSVRLDPAPIKVLTLGTAVPRGDRFDWLVEKATELGVSQLIPLTTLRSVVDPRSTKLEKLRQTVIAACKQSGRNHLMQISEVLSFGEFLKRILPGHRTLVAHPGGENFDSLQYCEPTAVNLPMAIAIGPEGGFSDEEIESATSLGAHTIQMGRNILRIETAAIALVAKILL